MVHVVIIAVISIMIIASPHLGWTGEAACANFPVGSLSRMECERNLRSATKKPAEPLPLPDVEPKNAPTESPPRPSLSPAPGRMDYDREAGRRICDAYEVTGNEWISCVAYFQHNPPCTGPPESGSPAGWETCVWSAVRSAQQRVAEARQQVAERRRQAELEERRVKAMEESAKAQQDQAHAQENIARALRQPVYCTTILIAPGLSRTICN